MAILSYAVPDYSICINTKNTIAQIKVSLKVSLKVNFKVNIKVDLKMNLKGEL